MKYQNTILNYLSILFFPIWFFECMIPRQKNKWLFGSWFGLKYSDNGKYLYEYILTNHKYLKPVWITKSKIVYLYLREKKYPVEMAYSIKGIYHQLTAAVNCICMGEADYASFFTNGIINVMLWHGVPMKKIGFDQFSIKLQKANWIIELLKKIKRFLMPWLKVKYHYCINTSPFFTDFLSSAFNIKKDRVLLTGYPRNDVIFRNKSNLIKKIRLSFPNSLILLYLPTHRLAAINGISFKPFDGFNFDNTLFQNFLEKENIVFLHKGHFVDKNLSEEIASPRFISISDEPFFDINELFSSIDVLLTDYSGAYFDFILTKKPVILTPFDYHYYIHNARDLYFDYFSNIEGAVAKDWMDVIQIISEKKYQGISEETINKFNFNRDDKSCARVVNTIISKLKYMQNI